MRYDFELLQKVRAISPTLISLWAAPQNYSDRKWRDLCGKYDATLQYWNGSSYVSGQNFTHPRGRSGGQGSFLGNAGASTRTSAVANSSGFILGSRGLFKTSWTITAWINVNTSNGTTWGRAVYCERAAAGNDIIKLECLNSTQGSTKVGVTLRNDGGTPLQYYPNTGKGIISDQWHFVAATMSSGTAGVYYNGILQTSSYSGTDTFTNTNVPETWLCGDKQDADASFVGYADFISVHSGTLNQGQLAAFEQLTSREIYSFDRQFPYSILVGEAAAAAGTSSGNAAVTVGAATCSGAATSTDPIYSGNAAVTCGAATATGTATSTAPIYSGNAAVTVGAATCSGAATSTDPIYTGTSAVTAGAATASGTALFATAVYSGNAAVTCGAATASGTATHTTPTFTGLAAVVTAAVTASGSATHTAPIYSGNAAVTTGPATATGTATFTSTTRTGTAAVTTGAATASGTATFVAPAYDTGTGYYTGLDTMFFGGVL